MGTCESLKTPGLEEFDSSNLKFDIPLKKNIGKYITNQKPIFTQTKNFTKLKGELTKIKIPIIIKKFPKTEKSKNLFSAEIFIFQKLDHPNILKILDFFQTVDHYFILYEFFDGIPLIDYFLQNSEFLNEKNICKCINDILLAINHVHSKGICHRNLDPKKIIYNGKTIVLTGLEHSRLFDKKNIIKFTNSPLKINFKAPEVIQKNFSEKSDIWNVGIIFLILITGKNLFEKKNTKKTVKSILKEEIEIEKINNLSYQGKEVLREMLEKIPEKRICAKKLLKLEWFKMEEYKNEEWDILADDLKNFQKRNKFLDQIKKLYIEKIMTLEEKSELVEIFKIFDINNDGILSLKEFQMAIKKTHLGFSNQDIDYLFIELDENRNGTIEYSEFVHGLMKKKAFLQKERIYDFFDFLDSNKDNCLSLKEFKKIVGEKNEFFESFYGKYFENDVINKENFTELILNSVNKFKNEK